MLFTYLLGQRRIVCFLYFTLKKTTLRLIIYHVKIILVDPPQNITHMVPFHSYTRWFSDGSYSWRSPEEDSCKRLFAASAHLSDLTHIGLAEACSKDTDLKAPMFMQGTESMGTTFGQLLLHQHDSVFSSQTNSKQPEEGRNKCLLSRSRPILSV